MVIISNTGVPLTRAIGYQYQQNVAIRNLEQFWVTMTILVYVHLWSHSQAVWNWDNAAWDADDSPPAVCLGATGVEEQSRREVRKQDPALL